MMMNPQYVRCVDNSGYEISLKEGEIYRVLERPTASANTLVILDETYGEPGSEEGYIFDRSRFEFLSEAELRQRKSIATTTHIDELT